jgi:hypothetical protein
MHLHRDLLTIADGYAKEVLKITPDDMSALMEDKAKVEIEASAVVPHI